MDYAKESLRLHGEWKGKIEVVTTVPVETKDDLSLAYTLVWHSLVWRSRRMWTNPMILQEDGICVLLLPMVLQSLVWAI